ncbi:MAG: hypothetical protein JXR27_05050 [Paludibacteraceae bacterium]|nr:hypothetical protein [Paludibacteraceae bacterium]
MTDHSFEENMLRMRLLYLRNEFSDLITRRNEMICHEDNYLQNLYLNIFGPQKYEIYCLKLDIAILKRRGEYLSHYITHNRIPELKVIEQELNKNFEQYIKQSEEEALKLAAAREYIENNKAEPELLKQATELYRTIIPHIHPKIYQESCARCVDLLAQTNSAYVTLDIQRLEKIATLTANIVKEDHFEDTKEFILFVDKIEVRVNKLRSRVESMNLDFPFCYRDKMCDEQWIASEIVKLDKEILNLGDEKRKVSDEVILCQLWKPDSLN